MPLLDARSDLQLLEAHRSGERRAFDELVRRHGDRLWAVALRVLRDPEDAADVLQDALESAYRRSAAFRGEASVSTWLHRIVVNKCVDRIRYDRARPPSGYGRPHRVPVGRDPAEGATTRLAVLDALANVPVDQRVPVVLVDVMGYPVAEAAAILQVPVGTVKSRCARGRVRLAGLLGHLREEGA
ncbi:RNA polymerase sigma factor SigM [Pseudonocardia sp. RS11V-5]|uniref:RNA polymerase sigma factor SigM n=1 Tax=Pseudonocardia terrae TaxID=2905831 RepID=UPI001E2A4330|nr:RNA polymerase sigma factor SigM [Pseudonocardia terrae]MCE3553545.1 RNA polymerase sigma factor SigM [Pseudonocardia terrae]